jgi:hypothetical protein
MDFFSQGKPIKTHKTHKKITRNCIPGKLSKVNFTTSEEESARHCDMIPSTSSSEKRKPGGHKLNHGICRISRVS